MEMNLWWPLERERERERDENIKGEQEKRGKEKLDGWSGVEQSMRERSQSQRESGVGTSVIWALATELRGSVAVMLVR
ncbi:hypothetical protein AB3S75_001465 [Citrus x aurantiifolia]